MSSPARRAAYEVLLAVEQGRSDLPAALARARRMLSDPRDRALTAEIATGTLRWQGELDAILDAFLTNPIARLDIEILIILRLAAYQVVHLDRVPSAAATSDAVDLTRHVRKASAARLVNAVLRSVVRHRHALPLPPRPDTVAPSERSRDATLEYLTTTCSHPRWLASRWLDRVGFEATERWTQFNNTAAPLTLRPGRAGESREQLAAALASHGVTTAPTQYAPDGLIVLQGNPYDTPLAAAGTFLVQDESSQLVAAFATARPGDHVLDCCAAPGGKTLLLEARMEGRGRIVAGDHRARRIDLLRETLRRHGAGLAHVVRFDARHALPFRTEPFDLVLVDAPCSGLGTIRRDPEVRWRRREEELPALAAVERLILEQAAGCVRPGGYLVYATCSSEPEENEAVVRDFLAAWPSFQLAHGHDWRRDPTLAPLLDADGLFRSNPAAHGLEAFFAARLRRVGSGL